MRRLASLPLLTILVGGIAAQTAITHKSKGVSVEVPAGWKVGKEIKQTDLGEDHAAYRVLSFSVTPPESDKGVGLEVEVVNTGAHRILPDIVRTRVYFESYQGVEKVDYASKPMPHLVVRQTKPRDVVLAIAFRRVTGRTVKLLARCSSAQWDVIRTAFFEMAKGMRVEMPNWPKRVGGRTEKQQDGMVFSAAEEVDKKQLREVQKCAVDVQKAVTEIHGKIARPKAEPLVVYVHALMAEHKRIAKDQRVAAVVRESGWRRVFTVPLEPRGSDKRAQFVGALNFVLLQDLYGSIDNLWFVLGESMVAQQRDATKKKLPSARKALLESLRVSMTLAELAEKKKVPAQDFYGECFAYVAMFHAGPGDYRKAYKSFLSDLQSTGDLEAAARGHLLSLDQSKLLEDVRDFVKKLRPVKVKVR